MGAARMACLMALLTAGCVSERAAEQVVHKRPVLAPAAADALVLQTVLIEQSLGDRFLDAELWQTYPSAVSGESKALLAENGLRACVIRGHAPARFLEMLTSEQFTIAPQLLTFSHRKQEVIPTNGPNETAGFPYLRTLGGKPSRLALQQATFGWQVQPEWQSGEVRIRCEPVVQHGDRQDWLRPTDDGTQFALRGEHPVIHFTELGFEATLGPRDFLVIGGVAEATDSLGRVAFRLDGNGQAKQRVLVIRAGKNLSERGSAKRSLLVSEATRGRGEPATAP